MSDACGQQSNGRQLIGLRKLRLQFHALGDVTPVDGDAVTRGADADRDPYVGCRRRRFEGDDALLGADLPV